MAEVLGGGDLWARRPRRPSRRRRSNRPPPACPPLEAIDASRGAIEAWSHQAARGGIRLPVVASRGAEALRGCRTRSVRGGRAWRSIGASTSSSPFPAPSPRMEEHASSVLRRPSVLLLPLSTDHFLAFVCCCYAYAFCCSRMLSLLDRAYHYIQRVSFRCNLHTCAKLPCLFSDLT